MAPARTAFNLKTRITSPPAFLLGAIVAAIVFLTLFPWTGWRSIPGEPWDFINEPWPRYWTWFDVISNVLAYVPLGIFATLLAARPVQYRSTLVQLAATFAAITVLGSALSLTLECIQSWLPNRFPTKLDWISNTLGAGVGSIIALTTTAYLQRGLLLEQYDLRSNWHALSTLPPGRLSLGIVSLSLWVLIQASPQRLLFASGDFAHLFEDAPSTVSLGAAGFLEAVIVMASMCIISSIIWTAIRNQLARRLALIVAFGGAALVKSVSSSWLVDEAENLWWLTPGAQAGLFLGAIAVALLITLKPKTQSKVAQCLIVAVMLLVNLAPDNPFYDTMIDRWDEGRWSSLHALIQTVAYLWPFLAFMYLWLARKAFSRTL
jgi:VanZ family protein